MEDINNFEDYSSRNNVTSENEQNSYKPSTEENFNKFTESEIEINEKTGIILKRLNFRILINLTILKLKSLPRYILLKLINLTLGYIQTRYNYIKILTSSLKKLAIKLDLTIKRLPYQYRKFKKLLYKFTIKFKKRLYKITSKFKRLIYKINSRKFKKSVKNLPKSLVLKLRSLPRYIWLKLRILINLYINLLKSNKYLYSNLRLLTKVYSKGKNLPKDLYPKLSNLYSKGKNLSKILAYKILYLKHLLKRSFAKKRYKISRIIASFIRYFNPLVKDLQRKEFINEKRKAFTNKIRSLSFKEIFYKTKHLLSLFVTLLKRKSYEIKNLSRKQRFKFVKSFSIQAKKRILIKYLKNFKLKFYMVKLLPSLKLKKQYIKFKKRLIVFLIKNTINFKEKQRYYFIELKKKLNYQISNSKRMQRFIIKFNEAKLLIFNLPTNFDNFIINVRYNHQLAREYAKLAREYAERILFVIVLYSLPLLILTKVFYTNILILAKAGDTRFDGLISEKQFNLLMYDKKVFAEYIPLEFVPRILQSTSIDFYIFLSYYTVFGTSKFPLNKELVYHGIICVAHLIVYASIGLIMSVIQNFTEFYTYIVGMWVRHFIATKFARFFKNKQLQQKASKFFLIKQALTEDPTAPFSEWSRYGICGMDRIVSRIPRSSETFFTAYLLTPISLYVLITLIYNCCYYIIYNKRPFIPVMTNLAKRITPNVKKDE